jgi:putative Mg2+ transporter-C (MgtC) family protein
MDYIFASFSFDWRTLLIDMLRITAAFLLAIPIGWERHRSSRNLGLRTFPIVSIGACAYVLVLKAFPGADVHSNARVIQGLLGGIGFIGGGAILKEGTSVYGIATAASIWTTGAIGAAVAFGRLDIAILLSGIIFIVLRTLSPIAEENRDVAAGDNGSSDSD